MDGVLSTSVVDQDHLQGTGEVRSGADDSAARRCAAELPWDLTSLDAPGGLDYIESWRQMATWPLFQADNKSKASSSTPRKPCCFSSSTFHRQ